MEPTIRFEYGRGDKRKAAEEPLRPPVLVNDMLPGFLLEHWGELMRGDAVRFRFVVVPRRETLEFSQASRS